MMTHEVNMYLLEISGEVPCTNTELIIKNITSRQLAFEVDTSPEEANTCEIMFAERSLLHIE